MRVLLQRVSQASVLSDGLLTGEIGRGLLILVGIEEADGEDDLDWLCRKVLNMRIFPDEKDQMNRSILDIDGDILLVSQFTLHAKTKKGNRPSFIKAARPEQAIPLYEAFKDRLGLGLGKSIPSGVFAPDMQVNLTNDGPVTIWLDSQSRE